VVAINRNGWSQSIVIGGRNQPVRPGKIRRGGNPIVSAAILGSIFNYVDFLTNPPWQPMLIAFVALCGGRSLFDAAKFVLAWLAGCALTWVSKWVIGYAWGIPWSDTFRMIRFRLDGNFEGVVVHRLFAPSIKILSFLFHQTQIAMTMLFLLPVLLLLVIRREIDWRWFVVLTSPALIPFVWFELMSNHTQIHTWFTYRPVASSIGIWMSAALIARGYSTTREPTTTEALHWRRNPHARKKMLPLYCCASTSGRELVTLEDASYIAAFQIMCSSGRNRRAAVAALLLVDESGAALCRRLAE
jgi:hypothetical protein